MRRERRSEAVDCNLLDRGVTRKLQSELKRLTIGQVVSVGRQGNQLM